MSFILAEFRGSYRAPHPDGIRDANVTKEFHVKVKMKEDSLLAPGLNGLFATYYKGHLRKLYPEMIDTYMFDLVQATQLDGTPIDNPKAMSHDALLAHIAKKKYPINPLLYSTLELRDEVVLYEQDASGQQYLQNKRQLQKGSLLATAAELQGVEDLMVVVDAPVKEQPVEKVSAPSVDALLAGAKKK